MLSAALTLAVVLSPTPAAMPGVPGTWVYHQPWERPAAATATAPATRSGDHARGAVLRFCPSGELLLVKGVLSRNEDSISFESGEGVQVWSGRWEADGVRLKMTYRSKSRDGASPGADEAARREIHAQAIPEANRMRFAIPGTGMRSFEPAAALTGAQADRVLACGDQPAREPARTPTSR